MTANLRLPAVPLDTPVMIETSFSGHDGPEAHGIDTRTQWWCEATRRPRFDDAIARVVQPGAEPYEHLVEIALPADDLDDTATVGRYAVNVTRCLVQLINDRDEENLDELKALLGPAGPMGSASSPIWHRVLEWLTAARSGDLTALEMHGDGWPEQWKLSDVAAYLDITPGSARVQMRRWGIEAVGRAPGRGGESLFAADQVRAAHLNRPGRGHRTDLRDEAQS
jgi:hypothetical protein